MPFLSHGTTPMSIRYIVRQLVFDINTIQASLPSVYMEHSAGRWETMGENLKLLK